MWRNKVQGVISSRGIASKSKRGPIVFGVFLWIFFYIFYVVVLMFVADSKSIFQKPSYKPLVSYVTERPPTQVGRQRSLTPVEDHAGQEESQEEPTTAVRDRFQEPENDEVRTLLQQHQEYLDGRGIEQSFLLPCRQLMSIPNLPYNPYPGFVRRIRRAAENFHLTQKTDSEIMKSLTIPTQPSRVKSIVSHSKFPSVLGLSGIIKMADPNVGHRYRWLMDSLTPKKETLKVDESAEYTTQAVPLLLGSCIFHGSLYPHPHDAVLRVEYIISGTDVEKGLDLYAESLLADLSHMARKSPHAVLGTLLPSDETDGLEKNWTWNDIAGNKASFKSIVMDQTKKTRTIDVMCVFRVAENEGLFISGCKQYTLNFVKVREDTGEDENVTPFTDPPMVALHKGLFLDLHHADSYTSAYSVPIKDHKQTGQPSSKKKKPSSKPGFQLDGSYTDPFSENIIEPIKLDLQKAIASLHPQTEIFEALPMMALLCILDETDSREKLLIDIYKMLHSTAYSLYHTQVENVLIQRLFIKFKKIQSSASDVLAQVLAQYRRNILDIFDKMNQEMSADMMETGRIIVHRVDEITVMAENSTSREDEPTRILQELRRLKGYVDSIQLLLVEDAYANCPEVKKRMTSLMEAFPENVPRPETPIKEVASPIEDKKKNKKKELRRGLGNENYSHGVEDKSIKRHAKEAIDVNNNTSKETAPKSLAKESVLLKYVVDTRMDNVWPEFLIELLTGESQPSNPYPRLVTTLRQSGQRMDLFYESSDKLSKRLLHGAARKEDEDSHTFNLPGAEAHGCASSLALVDSSVFFQLVALCQPFITSEYVQKKGPYRVAICTGLGGHTPLYGRLAPYIMEVHLEEHCFLRGPDDGADASLAVYAKIVNDSVSALRRDGQHIVTGPFAGGLNTPVQDIKKNWRDKEDVYVKIYTKMDWRYVAIVKHFKPHYITLDETRRDEYFPKDPAAYYQVVFFERDKAVFYDRYGGPSVNGNPFSTANIQIACQAINKKVAEACQGHDWINVHRWLLTRNLISQGKSHIAEVWRMLHSVGAKFEYLLCLVTSIIDIISYALTQLNEGEAIQDYFLGGIDLKFLGRMAKAFRQKVIEVCEMPITMTALSLLEVIVRKMQQITERLSDTREVLLVLTPETIQHLVHLAGMLEALRDTSAYDLHLVSPEAQAMVRAIVTDTPRPTSTQIGNT